VTEFVNDLCRVRVVGLYIDVVASDVGIVPYPWKYWLDIGRGTDFGARPSFFTNAAYCSNAAINFA
jgi:hypothetical protein